MLQVEGIFLFLQYLQQDRLMPKIHLGSSSEFYHVLSCFIISGWSLSRFDHISRSAWAVDTLPALSFGMLCQ
jgi:hypothetical protein